MRLLGYCGRWISHEGPLQGSGTSIIPNSDPPSSLSSRTTLLVPVLVERFPYLQLPAGAEFLNNGILYPSMKAANKTRQDKTRYWIRNEYLHKTHKVSFTQAFLSKTLEGTSYLHTHEIKKNHCDHDLWSKMLIFKREFNKHNKKNFRLFVASTLNLFYKQRLWATIFKTSWNSEKID